MTPPNQVDDTRGAQRKRPGREKVLGDAQDAENQSVATRRHRRRAPAPDPAPDYTEWVRHRYDPGYYLGGRIPPYLKRKRDGNSWGWVLIGGALVGLVLLIGENRQTTGPEKILGTMFASAAALLQLLAGIRLIQADPTSKRH